MDDGLRGRLKKLGVVQGLAGLRQAPTEAGPVLPGLQSAPRRKLPGSVHVTAEGPFWLSRQVYRADHAHGRQTFEGLMALDADALALMGVPNLGPRPAFIDTETTGLAGGSGTLAFLVGVGVWDGAQLALDLIFMRNPQEEPAALAYLTDVLRGATGLVSFNGRGFDVPILEARYIVNRMVPDALEMPHLDLLTVARQLWRDHLASRRLGELERRVLGITRTDQDLESALIPMLYRQYLETDDPTEIARIFYHNEIDVLTLVSLLIHAGRMVTAPEAMGLAPGEWAGVGRVFEKAGREAVAVDAWQRALAAESGSLNPETAARLWGELALRHKRRGEWAEALSIWDTWAQNLPWAIAPLVEKAMYYEWTDGRCQEALKCCGVALERVSALPLGPARKRLEADLHHREERLKRRLVTVRNDGEGSGAAAVDVRRGAEGARRSERVRVVLATHNAGKRREWTALLDGLDLDLVLPEDVGPDSEVDENAATYVGNALLKARALAQVTGLPALADDSGLEVDALDGAPGVHSARFRPGPDAVRYQALLDALVDVPPAARTARFRCWAALALPDGRAYTAEGVCEGVIAQVPAGDLGFGYDPVFLIPEVGQTMAELAFEVKNRLSHRAVAARTIRPVLVEVLGR